MITPTKKEIHTSFSRYNFEGMVLVLLAPAIGAVLHETWLVGKLQLAKLDSLFVLSRQADVSNVAIVEISNADYSDPKLFKATSPLAPALLQRLIRAIDDAGAQAIGVDILTAEWRRRQPST